jgi:hypothetical protein
LRDRSVQNLPLGRANEALFSLGGPISTPKMLACCTPTGCVLVWSYCLLMVKI